MGRSRTPLVLWPGVAAVLKARLASHLRRRPRRKPPEPCPNRATTDPSLTGRPASASRLPYPLSTDGRGSRYQGPRRDRLHPPGTPTGTCRGRDPQPVAGSHPRFTGRDKCSGCRRPRWVRQQARPELASRSVPRDPELTEPGATGRHERGAAHVLIAGCTRRLMVRQSPQRMRREPDAEVARPERPTSRRPSTLARWD
jgi:hypothetical protein